MSGACSARILILDDYVLLKPTHYYNAVNFNTVPLCEEIYIDNIISADIKSCGKIDFFIPVCKLCINIIRRGRVNG